VQSDATCKDANRGWQIEPMVVDSGILTKLVFLLALPAFLVGSLIVVGSAKLGISQVLTFLLFMPLLIAGWLYYVGRFIDHRKRPHPR